MKRLMYAMVVLLCLPLLAAAPGRRDELTIKSGSNAVVTLSDGTTINMRFTVAPDGTISWLGALGRDQFFYPPVSGGSPTPPPPPPVPVGPTIVTTALPNAVVGTAYAASLAATGGVSPYTWSVKAGALPGGLSILPAGGVVGIPTTAATSIFTVAVTDTAGQSTSGALSITVTAIPVPPPPPPGPTKLRVVIFADAGKLTEPQMEMLTGPNAGLLDWLAKNCLAINGVPEWRRWPSDTKSTDVIDRFVPMVSASGGVSGIVVQQGENGPVTRIELSENSVAAIASLEKLANPRAPPKGTFRVIDESNFRQLIRLHPTGYIKGTNPPNLPRLSAVYPKVPRSQWPALHAQAKGTYLGDLIRAAKIPVKDQDGLGYCWVYASTSCVEAIRALQGQPLLVLSPESVGGPVTGWRNQGGWGYDALEQLTKAGACETSYMDSANSLRPSRWKAGWEANAELHKITDAWATIDDDGFDGVVTAVLLRLPVSIGLDWWGHQVIITGLVDLGNGKWGVEFRNSWGDWEDDGWSTLTEAKAQPSGSFACVSVGTSDKALNDKARGTVADLVLLRQAAVKRQIQRLTGTASVTQTLAPRVVLYEFVKNGCPPCDLMKPTVERIKADGYRVATYNVSEGGEATTLGMKYKVEATPTFVVLEDGREIDRIIGATTEERLKEKLQLQGK